MLLHRLSFTTSMTEMEHSRRPRNFAQIQIMTGMCPHTYIMFSPSKFQCHLSHPLLQSHHFFLAIFILRLLLDG
jgi:hypothetical protein